MKKYKCHKVVEAAKITSVTKTPGGTYGLGTEDSDAIAVSSEWASKHNPSPGCYFVQYADGYTSISPGDAFEAGYSLLDVAEPGPAEAPNDFSGEGETYPAPTQAELKPPYEVVVEDDAPVTMTPPAEMPDPVEGAEKGGETDA